MKKIHFDYYVYVYFDTRKLGKWEFRGQIFDFEPFYVGYGRRRRISSHVEPWQLKRNTLKSNIINLIISETGNKPKYFKISESLNEQEACDLEIEFIKKFGRRDLGTGILCNHTQGGRGVKGGNPNKNKYVRKTKEFKTYTPFQYSYDGDFIECYKNITEAQKKTGLWGISKVIEGKRFMAGECFWFNEFKGDRLNDEFLKELKARRKLSDFDFKFIGPDGNLVSGINLKGFAESLGGSYWCFREVFQGRKESYMGYKSDNPEFEEKFKKFKYRLVSPSGEIHDFNSLGKFAKDHDLSEQALSGVVLQKYGHHKGWKLENPPEKFAESIKLVKGIYLVMDDNKIHHFPSEASIRRTYKIGYGALRTILMKKESRLSKFKNIRVPTDEDFLNMEIIKDGLSIDEFLDKGGEITWERKSRQASSNRVDCFDLSGNYIKTFESVSQAQKTINFQKVREAIKKPFEKQAGGFYWKLSDPISEI